MKTVDELPDNLKVGSMFVMKDLFDELHDCLCIVLEYCIVKHLDGTPFDHYACYNITENEISYVEANTRYRSIYFVLLD